jgi:hypothetical protein
MTDSQIQRDGEPEEVELYTIEVNGSPVVISAFEVGDTAGAIAAAANKILVEAYPMYCGKAFMTLVGAEITVREPTELEVKEWDRSNAATGMLHIVLPKPKQRQAGEAIASRGVVRISPSP